jgi:hypothetical protein
MNALAITLNTGNMMAPPHVVWYHVSCPANLRCYECVLELLSNGMHVKERGFVVETKA